MCLCLGQLVVVCSRWCSVGSWRCFSDFFIWRWFAEWLLLLALSCIVVRPCESYWCSDVGVVEISVLLKKSQYLCAYLVCRLFLGKNIVCFLWLIILSLWLVVIAVSGFLEVWLFLPLVNVQFFLFLPACVMYLCDVLRVVVLVLYQPLVTSCPFLLLVRFCQLYPCLWQLSPNFVNFGGFVGAARVVWRYSVWWLDSFVEPSMRYVLERVLVSVVL